MWLGLLTLSVASACLLDNNELFAQELRQAIDSGDGEFVLAIHRDCFWRVLSIDNFNLNRYAATLPKGQDLALGVISCLSPTFSSISKRFNRLTDSCGHDMQPMVKWWGEDERQRGFLLRLIFTEAALSKIGIDPYKWIDSPSWEGLVVDDGLGLALPDNLQVTMPSEAAAIVPLPKILPEVLDISLYNSIRDPLQFVTESKLNHRRFFQDFGNRGFLNNVAISGNQPWIDALLLVFTPEEILHKVKVKEARGLIRLMIQLSPNAKLYQGEVEIDKHSHAFQKWVLFALDCVHQRNPVAKERLKRFYFGRLFTFDRDPLSSIDANSQIRAFGLCQMNATASTSYLPVTSPTFKPLYPTLEPQKTGHMIANVLIGVGIVAFIGAFSKLRI